MLLVILIMRLIFHLILLLTNAQVSRLHKAFANGSSDDKKLLRTQLYKTKQSGGFLDTLLGPFLKPCLPLMEIVLKPLTKSVLIPLGLAAAWAADAAIHEEIFGSGGETLIILNEEMSDIIKIVKSLK